VSPATAYHISTEKRRQATHFAQKSRAPATLAGRNEPPVPVFRHFAGTLSDCPIRVDSGVGAEYDATSAMKCEGIQMKRRLSHQIAHFGCLLSFVLVASSLGMAQTRELMPVPDVPGYKTLKCDFHMHTVYSDGEVWPTTRLSEAWRDGLDVISITDHSDYNPHKEDLKPDCGRAYELIRPLAERLGIVLIPAVEVAEKDIHFNALFVTDANAFKGAKLIEALQKARTQDAFAFWNHPGWKQTAEWFPLVAEAHGKKLFQGMELVNGDSFYPEAYPWVEEKKLTILANSDEHGPMMPSQRGGTRPITLVFVRTADIAGVREALFERRTAAWMGGEIWGTESHLKGLWEGALKVENPELSVRAGAPGAVLRLRNDSAIPLKVRVRKTPAWLRGPSGEFQVRGQSITARSVAAAKNTPSGLQQVEVELEITNFHIGPGKNLSVRLPLRVSVLP
jgi:hypothetical protein